MEKHLFQVNLEGVLNVLSNHLYSSEQVYIRELLQNAVDAITARKKIHPHIEGEINIELFENENSMTLSMEDNGIGLTKNEVVQFLSSIGASTKRGYLEVDRSDFIGRFGIGLLSCFMISDHITLITKSEKSEKAVKWIGKTDGSYELAEIDSSLEVGTKVYLKAKKGKNHLLKEEMVEKLVIKYGNLLQFPIFLTTSKKLKRRLNSSVAPWEEIYVDENEKNKAILAFGNQAFHIPFQDYFHISVDGGCTEGVVYISPYPSHSGNENQHCVYLKRMLISDKIDNLLPKWAFFVRCILNSSTLQPTASRESFYEDEHLIAVSKEIGDSIRKHLFYLSKNEPNRLRYILAVHSIALKAMALADDEFFNIMMPWFKFATTSGDLTIMELDKNRIVHVPNIDRFRQISPVAISQQQTIINSGFIHDAGLLTKLGHLNSDYNVEEINSDNFIDIFEDISVEERNKTFDFQYMANDILKKRECKIKIKRFAPSSLSAIYYSAKSSFDIHLNQSNQVANDMWLGMLGGMQTEVKYSTLCLNIDNEMVQTLLQLPKPLLKSMLEILYVNAMLMGHYPLDKNEINLLNNNLLDILKTKLT